MGVTVPFCETREEWTGYYEIVGYEAVQVPYPDYREEPVLGTGVWRLEKERVPPYTAYRSKVRWVNKVVSIARTILTPVTRWIRKVKTWFERTWLGKLLKRVTTWLEPVTEWIKKTVWDRVSRWIRETFMEPYPVYNYENIPVWIPLKTRLVSFTNYYDVKTPIKEKIMETVNVLVNRWTKVEGRDIPQWVLQEMFHRLLPCRPIEGRLEEIYETWGEFREGLTVYRRAHVDRVYRDEFRIFLDGLPEETDYQLARIATLSNGFGQGPRSWEDYTADNANAAQYFRLRELAYEWGWDEHEEYGASNGVHYNLCGQLAVIGAVGDTLPDGLSLFNDIVFKTSSDEVRDHGEDVLKENRSTWYYHLRDFLREYGWEAGSSTGDVSLEDLISDLRGGEAVVALVNLDTWTEVLVPGEGDRYTAHWVTVLQVLRTVDGRDAVRVYNSFQNREEYYTWDRFHAVWEETDGNSSVCMRVNGRYRSREHEGELPE